MFPVSFETGDGTGIIKEEGCVKAYRYTYLYWLSSDPLFRYARVGYRHPNKVLSVRRDKRPFSL